MNNRIIYYKDDNLIISFSQNPHVEFRYPCPGDTEEQEEDKLKKPFINLTDLTVDILYKTKNKHTAILLKLKKILLGMVRLFLGYSGS